MALLAARTPRFSLGVSSTTSFFRFQQPILTMGRRSTPQYPTRSIQAAAVDTNIDQLVTFRMRKMVEPRSPQSIVQPIVKQSYPTKTSLVTWAGESPVLIEQELTGFARLSKRESDPFDDFVQLLAFVPPEQREEVLDDYASGDGDLQEIHIVKNTTKERILVIGPQKCLGVPYVEKTDTILNTTEFLRKKIHYARMRKYLNDIGASKAQRLTIFWVFPEDLFHLYRLRRMRRAKVVGFPPRSANPVLHKALKERYMEYLVCVDPVEIDSLKRAAQSYLEK